MKPVLIDPRVFRPMPDKFHGALCFRCNKPQSKWEFWLEPTDEEKAAGEGQTPAYICSWCVLYDSPWGKRVREELDALINEIENESGKKFLRDPEGRLLSDRDATAVLASIALISRMVQLRAEKLAGHPLSIESEEKAEGEKTE